jgi:hypothetical protein
MAPSPLLVAPLQPDELAALPPLKLASFPRKAVARRVAPLAETTAEPEDDEPAKGQVDEVPVDPAMPRTLPLPSTDKPSRTPGPKVVENSPVTISLRRRQMMVIAGAGAALAAAVTVVALLLRSPSAPPPVEDPPSPPAHPLHAPVREEPPPPAEYPPVRPVDRPAGEVVAPERKRLSIPRKAKVVAVKSTIEPARPPRAPVTPPGPADPAPAKRMKKW